MNDIVVKKQSEGDEAEPKEKKRDELREGNSHSVPKSAVPVGKLKQREREWQKEKKIVEQEKQKGFGNQEILRLEILYR